MPRAPEIRAGFARVPARDGPERAIECSILRPASLSIWRSRRGLGFSQTPSPAQKSMLLPKPCLTAGYGLT